MDMTIGRTTDRQARPRGVQTITLFVENLERARALYMLRRMASDAIRSDPAWRGGDYAEQPPGLTTAISVLLLMVSAPARWQREAPTAAQADALFERMVGEYRATLDANDLLYQINDQTHGHRGRSWPILWREHLSRLLDRLPAPAAG